MVPEERSVSGASYLRRRYETAVVVGADALSRVVDWDDRGTCILFGDGAGAVVLRRSDAPGVLGFAMRSDGTGASKLSCAFGGAPVRLGETGLAVAAGPYVRRRRS